MLDLPSKSRFPLNRKKEKTRSSSATLLADVTLSAKTELQAPIQWVGMESMELPLRFQQDDENVMVSAKVNGFVSLNDESSKGIHMSRLYEILLNRLGECQISGGQDFSEILLELVQSQKGLSKDSRLDLSFSLPLTRLSLKSGKKGFRTYPVNLTCEWKSGKLKLLLKTTVLYSSTCPCSAALSRQLNRDQFLKVFGSQKSVDVSELAQWMVGEEAMAATPHAQRSEAEIELHLYNDFGFSEIAVWIDRVEDVLKTPVQTAVKREDEQEFARLNAANLMFCEDAARRLKHLFDDSNELNGYWARVRHMESLHPHDAVAIIEG